MDQNLEPQLDWDVSKLHGRWPTGRDNLYIMERLKEVAVETTAANATGRVLEVAAAEAILSCKLNLCGLESFVLEPSPVMLEKARVRSAEYGAKITLVRGIAEALPFPDGSFDRVLCDSAIDHMADPQRSIAEMARVLAPQGRLVLGTVNYGSLSVRLSRVLYRLGRSIGVAARDEHLFWDTPVPIEHTFECTYPILLRLCDPYLELDRAFGVSMGWMVPGWGTALGGLSEKRARDVLGRLDRWAHERPEIADYVISVWRRRRSPSAARPASAPSASDLVVSPDDVVYPGRIRAEAEYWAQADFDGGIAALVRAGERYSNQAFTGDPERSWLSDLAARGPFEHAAMLGCDDGGEERAWIDSGASRQLDVYELSRGVIHKVKASLGARRLGPPWRRRVRFIESDLNFARLPANRYDVVWSSGCLHHIVNLEHLFREVERALRPGGLFALHDYVGERRSRFDPDRLARINDVLRRVPMRFRRGGVEEVKPPALDTLQVSPFCGVRSDETLAVARRRFEVVHLAETGALFPLEIIVDLPAIEREDPALLRWLLEEEKRAVSDGMTKCGAYAVFRKQV